MDPALIFKISNFYVVIGWILLLFAPKWKHTHSYVLSTIILLLSLLYLALIAPTILDFNPETFSSLANVRALFQDDIALTAGWVHYLAFDLFVGTYIVREGIVHQIPRWKYSLCLPFTFMFGPVGLLFFFFFKWTKQ